MRLEDLIRHSAATAPDRLAISNGPEGMTYAQLWARSCSIAQRLAPDINVGDRVLICSAKSLDTVAAMQAVLLLGAAYVPVDGRMPALRAKLIAEDCDPALCLVDSTTAGIIPDLPSDLPAFALESITDDTSVPAPPSVGKDDDLAYILYTSGSTGRPKGVSLTHRNALAFVQWAVEEVGITENDRLSSHAPFTFDLSVFDLYAAFAGAASVHLIDTDYAYAPDRLTKFLYESEISIWYSVPSALGMMVQGGGLLAHAAPDRLRAVLVAGEPCPMTLLRSLREWTGARLLNLYGPTETNVCTFREVSAADLMRDMPPPIGSDCSSCRTWVESANGVEIEPGAEGELVVDGPSVMRGYWGGEAQLGPYRTGDIVRIREDRAYDFIGRLDHMVKIRGHRVELGEIEAAVLAHPDVEEATVSVEGAGPDAAIVAYVRGKEGPTLLGLKAFCAERLPRYMIPDRLHRLQEFPRTFNGKIDRKALGAS